MDSEALPVATLYLAQHSDACGRQSSDPGRVNPVDPVRSLRNVARLCGLGLPLPTGLAAWMASSLGDFLSHRAPSMEEAFGIVRMRGDMPCWREAAARERNDALCRLATDHFSHLSMTAQARCISAVAEHYAATAWRFDRDQVEMPSLYHGSVRGNLWAAFKAGAPMPICERQLRTILRHRGSSAARRPDAGPPE